MQPGISVQNLNTLSESALSDIIDASWRHWRSLGMCDEESSQAWRDYLRYEDINLPRAHFIVSDQGRVVAMGSIAEKDFPEIPSYSPWLINLFVLPSHRNQRLAAMLREHRLAVLKQLGYTSAYILAAPGTERLHEAAGFVMLDPKLNVMQKAL